jgi:hypothetical protein
MSIADWCSVISCVVGVPISIYLLRFALSVKHEVRRVLGDAANARLAYDTMPRLQDALLQVAGDLSPQTASDHVRRLQGVGHQLQEVAARAHWDRLEGRAPEGLFTAALRWALRMPRRTALRPEVFEIDRAFESVLTAAVEAEAGRLAEARDCIDTAANKLAEAHGILLSRTG